jgi:hypothetical protein
MDDMRPCSIRRWGNGDFRILSQMPIYSSHKDLFRNATIQDKLTLFKILLDAKDDMSAELALALLKIIHKDLSTHQTRDRSPYKAYAEMVEALRFQMPAVLKQVVESWKDSQNLTPSEWFSERKNLW